MRVSAGRSAFALLALLLLAAVTGTPAQEGAGAVPQRQPDSPVDPNAPEEQPPPVLSPSEYSPGERPAPKEKLYEEKPIKIFAAILKALAEAEIPIESSDEAAGYVKTNLISFDHNRFFDVAQKPPRISRDRMIGQMVRLTAGKFSMEVQASKTRKGTNVSVRAYIEEKAYDMRWVRRIWVERFSNGRIEDYFFTKLDAAIR